MEESDPVRQMQAYDAILVVAVYIGQWQLSKMGSMKGWSLLSPKSTGKLVILVKSRIESRVTCREPQE